MLSVVIVSWNGREMLRDCLRSLREAAPRAEVVVSDNGSSDGTVEMVRVEFPAVVLVENGRNLGFAAGANRGLKRATRERLLLLNSDTIVRREDLQRLEAALEADPGAGMAAPKLLHEDGSHQRSASGLPDLRSFFYKFTLLRIWRRWSGDRRRRFQEPSGDTPTPVDCVIGAVLLIRKEALSRIGYLDEDYFFYYEDIDLCRRLRDGGWRILYCPAAIVRHRGGASSEKNYTVVTRMYFRAVLIYFRKHFAPTCSPAVRVLFKILFALNILYDTLKTGSGLLWRWSRASRKRKRMRALLNFLRYDLRPGLRF